MNKRISGSIMLLTTALIWGIAFVAQSDGMNYVEPFTYGAVRTLLGGVVLIPVIALFRRSGGKKTQTAKSPFVKTNIVGGICCGVMLFAASSLQQIGIKYTTAGKAGFITALYVIIVPMIELVFYRRSSLKIWLCTAAAAGFYLLCINEGFTVSKGDLYVLASALFFALHIMTVDRFNKKAADGTVMSCIQFFTAGTLMLICMFIFEKPEISGIIAAWLPILYGGVMSCGVAYTLQIPGQRYTDPTVATLLMSLESVFAALAGALLLSETLSLKELSGCALVFAAVIAAQINFKRKRGKGK